MKIQPLPTGSADRRSGLDLHSKLLLMGECWAFLAFKKKKQLSPIQFEQCNLETDLIWKYSNFFFFFHQIFVLPASYN